MTDHKCVQENRIRRNEQSIDRFHETLQDISEMKGAVKQIPQQLQSLNVRVDDAFKASKENSQAVIAKVDEHIKDSPEYRERIATVETKVKDIQTERHMAVKKSQWRTALIVGLICAVPGAVAVIFLILAYFKG